MTTLELSKREIEIIRFAISDYHLRYTNHLKNANHDLEATNINSIYREGAEATVKVYLNKLEEVDNIYGKLLAASKEVK